MTRVRIDTEAMHVPARNPPPAAHDQELMMADFEMHPAGTRDRIATMKAQCELWWGMLDDRAGLIREYKARAERAEAALERLGPIAHLLPNAVAAAEKAMRKFPQPNYVISKWAEETGEVTKDLIHVAEGRQDVLSLRAEMVQALAMLHRILVEGDQVHGLPPVAPAILAALKGGE